MVLVTVGQGVTIGGRVLMVGKVCTVGRVANVGADVCAEIRGRRERRRVVDENCILLDVASRNTS